MKIAPSTVAAQRGSAVVVVLAVLVLILVIMAGNNVTLRSLHREVQLIEQRQLRKYASPPESPLASGTVLDTAPAGRCAPSVVVKGAGSDY